MDIKEIDLNKLVEETTLKMIDVSNDTAPVLDYTFRTIKQVGDHFFEIEMKINPMTMNDEITRVTRNFLDDLDDLKKERSTIDELIEKYKKFWFLK